MISPWWRRSIFWWRQKTRTSLTTPWTPLWTTPKVDKLNMGTTMEMKVDKLEMTIGWVKNSGVVEVWGAAVSVDNLIPINI